MLNLARSMNGKKFLSENGTHHDANLLISVRKKTVHILSFSAIAAVSLLTCCTVYSHAETYIGRRRLVGFKVGDSVIVTKRNARKIGVIKDIIRGEIYTVELVDFDTGVQCTTKVHADKLEAVKAPVKWKCPICETDNARSHSGTTDVSCKNGGCQGWYCHSCKDTHVGNGHRGCPANNRSPQSRIELQTPIYNMDEEERGEYKGWICEDNCNEKPYPQNCTKCLVCAKPRRMCTICSQHINMVDRRQFVTEKACCNGDCCVDCAVEISKRNIVQEKAAGKELPCPICSCRKIVTPKDFENQLPQIEKYKSKGYEKKNCWKKLCAQATADLDDRENLTKEERANIKWTCNACGTENNPRLRADVYHCNCGVPRIRSKKPIFDGIYNVTLREKYNGDHEAFAQDYELN